MNQTSTVRFSGQSIETIVTNMASPVDKYINHVRSMPGPLIVGLDCECKPGKFNKTAILQLCFQNKCLIVQIFHMAHIPESLKSFLSDPSATFVGAGVDRDATNLWNDYRLIVSNVVDLQRLAKTLKDSPFGSELPGLRKMALEFAGLRMEKPDDVTRSNWEDMELSREQIEYACIDAYASYKIGYKLLVGSEGGVGLGWRLLKLMVNCVGLGWRLLKLMVYLVGIWIALDWFF